MPSIVFSMPTGAFISIMKVRTRLEHACRAFPQKDLESSSACPQFSVLLHTSGIIFSMPICSSKIDSAETHVNMQHLRQRHRAVLLESEMRMGRQRRSIQLNKLVWMLLGTTRWLIPEVRKSEKSQKNTLNFAPHSYQPMPR